MWKRLTARATGCLVGFCLLFSLASAIEINGYSPARHARFSSGFPSAPVANTNGNFIGLGYDWSGVGWNPSNTVQSVALLAPGFFLYANHYPPGSTLEFFSSDGHLKTYTVQTLSGCIDNASCDLGIGMLTSPVPASDHVTYYPIRFLGYSDSSYVTGFYNGVSGNNNLLIYGRQGDSSSNGPEIGKDTTTYVYDSITLGDGSYHSGEYFWYATNSYTPDVAHLEPGDSGSPSFFYNSSTHQLYLAGAHFAADSTQAVNSALPLMLNYVEAYMAQTGHLPYVVTPSTATWSGTDGQWGSTGNWSLGEGTTVITADTLNGSGQVTTCASLVFNGSSGTASRTISLGGVQRTVTGITFTSAPGANAFTFNSGGSGGSLRIGEAGIVNNDDDSQVFNCNIVLRSPQRWSIGTGGLSVAGTIDTGAGNLLIIEGNGTATLSGQIFDSGGLAKDGSGTLTISNSGNAYTGGTWIHAGTLALGNSNVIPSASNVVVDGGILNIDGYSDVVASLTLQNGTVSGTTGVLSSSSFDLRNGTVTANLGDAGILSKSTTGTVVLSGSNSYTGGTTINGGVLQFAATSAIPTSGNITINSGGILQASGAYSQVGGTTGWLASGKIGNTSAGTIALIQDEGGINMAGYANLSLGAIGNVTYTGTLTPENNIYRLGGGGGTLTVNSNLVDSSSRSLVVGSGSGGIVILAGTGDNYSGGTTVSAGTLQLGNASALGSTLGQMNVASGATLNVNGYTVTIGSLSGQGVVSLPGGKLFIGANNGSTTFSGTISGAGQLEKIGGGTLSLSGSNTYGGITTISGGTLQIGGGGNAGSLGSNSVVNNADLWFNRSDNITVSNAISGSGNVQQKGAGILTLSASNAYAGTTTVASGTLKLANAWALGTIAAGTMVQNGGALDLNGLNIGNEALTIIGGGSGGNGALINGNSSATAVFNGPVTLGGYATVGGSGNITLNGIMNYGSYAFTKTGSNSLTFTGPQIWGNNATATVETGTLSYQLAASMTATVGTNTPSLYINAGDVVNVNAANCDPFTDGAAPTQHVQIINNTGGSFNLTAGTVSLAGISGGGSTTVQGGAVLYSSYISQSQLTLGPGSTVVINPISGGPLASFTLSSLSTSSLSTLLSSDLANLNPAAVSSDLLSVSSQSGANASDLAPVSISGLSVVPEPSTWILIVVGALCLLCRRMSKWIKST